MDNAPNHEEALQLAYLKINESNLARCYIDLFRKWEALSNKHPSLLAVDLDSGIAITESGVYQPSQNREDEHGS